MEEADEIETAAKDVIATNPVANRFVLTLLPARFNSVNKAVQVCEDIDMVVNGDDGAITLQLQTRKIVIIAFTV